ncbi:methyltransferase domain-containing protein [Fusarium austroafricanum]|uniref:Methyltransferase domain-containing protein n=1 Tax=Fusarium austroafricanum TaxID=2364996 RepID=A0A8H4K7V2_9HYPO|nr:methyltransferase domain-containing protein [Fusarium austroafricanum]
MTGTAIYTLNNGGKGVEENRLDYQHTTWSKITETLIPDDIKSHLESLDRPPAVADVATGTGIWLQDLASEVHGDARLDGFDMDDTKFLPPKNLPPNVKLSLWNVFEPVPPELAGQYDLVHVRLLMVALKAEDWEPVARNLKSLLRPGGYLLWDETGFTKFNSVPITEAYQKWISTDVRYALSVGRDVTSPMPLEGHFRNAGYVECSHIDFSSFSGNAEVRRRGGSTLVNYARQSLNGIAARGGFEWIHSHDDVEKHCAKLQSEIDEGVSMMGFELRWTIGRKPE